MPPRPRVIGPGDDPAPRSNGEHQPVELVLTGVAAHRLEHLSRRLGRPVNEVAEHLVTYVLPPTPTERVRS